MKNSLHSVRVNDSSIVSAFLNVHEHIVHADAMSEGELVMVRNGFVLAEHRHMISLCWLRNRIVQLRKSGRMKDDAPDWDL